MRQLILKRIASLKIQEGGFDTQTTRWKEFKPSFTYPHISVLDFEILDDTTLLMYYERIVRQCTKQF